MREEVHVCVRWCWLLVIHRTILNIVVYAYVHRQHVEHNTTQHSAHHTRTGETARKSTSRVAWRGVAWRGVAGVAWRDVT